MKAKDIDSFNSMNEKMFVKQITKRMIVSMNNSQSSGQGIKNFVMYKNQFIESCRYSRYNPEIIITELMKLMNNTSQYYSSQALIDLVVKYTNVLTQIPQQLRIAKQQFGTEFNIDLNKKIENIHKEVNQCKDSIDVLVAAKRYVNNSNWNIDQYRGNKAKVKQRWNETAHFVHNIFGRLKKRDEIFAMIVLEVYKQINKWGDQKLKILKLLIQESKTEIQKAGLQNILDTEISFDKEVFDKEQYVDDLTVEQKHELFINEVLGE